MYYSSLIVLNIPVIADISPACKVPLATKITNLSEIARPTFVFLPLANDGIVRRADKFAIITPADVRHFTGVAVDKWCAVAEDGDGG
ncbi:hypothetical protein HG530_008899 [Fusarium avenaceum]|nr:hypothetical protein HG530_008899 [Fusarium avenaceum]